MRYTAHTLDGSYLIARDTAQQIADGVIGYTRAFHTPRIAYTFDNRQGVAYPYTVWTIDCSKSHPLPTTGESFATFDEVIDYIKGAK